jgi:hypothetical protein
MGAIGKRLIPTMSHTEQANCSHLLSICAQSVVPADTKVEFAPSNPLDQVFDFIDLLDAYRPYGGLSRMQGLLAGGRVRCDGQDRLVKDLVDSGELIAFSWHDAVWMPMFQFDMLGLGVEPKPHAIVTTFGFGYDGWAVASWFVQPNPWLESQFPIECLGSRLSDVMYAARSHHFTKVR